MSTSISNSLLSGAMCYRAPAAKCQPDSFQQVAARAQNAEINIVTDEGDLVTIASSASAAQALAVRSGDGPAGSLQSFTAAGLEAASFSLAVQGDLSEEELRDIATLLDDLTGIAEEFFYGNQEKAVAEAMQFRDLGSLAQFSSTFTRTIVTATTLTTAHPLPASDFSNDDLLAELQALADKKTDAQQPSFDRLRAQWDQIKDYLDKRDAEQSNPGSSGNAVEKTERSPGRHMVARAGETVGRHPRLSPFVLPVANRAVEQAQGPFNTSLEGAQARNFLKQDFLHHFNDWLFSA